jgi:hypothetical protein
MSKKQDSEIKPTEQNPNPETDIRSENLQNLRHCVHYTYNDPEECGPQTQVLCFTDYFDINLPQRLRFPMAVFRFSD